MTMDPKKLAAGVLARVGKRGEVTSLDVGRVLFTKVTAKVLRNTINQMVFEQCIAHEAARLDVVLTTADLEMQYAKRKKAFESSGRNQDIPYEQWLEAFGSNKKKELQSKSLRTKLLHGKLVERRNPDEFLDQRLAENRDLMMRRHGARRAISVIFIRAHYCAAVSCLPRSPIPQRRRLPPGRGSRSEEGTRLRPPPASCLPPTRRVRHSP